MKLYLLFIALLIFSWNAAAEDARFDGHALKQFQNVGAWGWYISVDNIISGPEDMFGRNISVYMTSANPDEYPPGFIDPNIEVGDYISVYGWLDTIEPGDYSVLLVGSKEYYIKRASSI